MTPRPTYRPPPPDPLTKPYLTAPPGGYKCGGFASRKGGGNLGQAGGGGGLGEVAQTAGYGGGHRRGGDGTYPDANG